MARGTLCEGRRAHSRQHQRGEVYAEVACSGPNYMAFFQGEQGRVVSPTETIDSAADVDDRPYRNFGLLLLQSSTKPVDASNTAQKGLDRILIGKKTKKDGVESAVILWRTIASIEGVPCVGYTLCRGSFNDYARNLLYLYLVFTESRYE